MLNKFCKKLFKKLVYVLIPFIFIGCEKDESFEVIEDVPGEEWQLLSNVITQDKGLPPDISSLQFIDDNTGFALTGFSAEVEDMFLLATKDGGNSWEKIIPVNENGYKLVFNKLFVKHLNEMYLSGEVHDMQIDEKGLFKSEDGGYTWKLLWDKVNTQAYFPSESCRIFSNSNTIFLSKDKGESCKKVYDNLDGIDLPVSKIQFINSEVGYANLGIIKVIEVPCCEAKGISFFIKTIDGGNTWQQLQDDEKPIDAVVAWNFVSTSVGYAFSFKDELLKTTDGGITWQVINNNLPQPGIFTSWFLDEQVGYYGTSDDKGLLFKTIDGGKTWKRAIPENKVFVEGMNAHYSTMINHLFFTATGQGYAAGKYGTIWKLKK